MIGIDTITQSIKDLFDTTLRAPAKKIPGVLMAMSLTKRPGLSGAISLGKIVQELDKNGIPTETLPDGSPNMMNKAIQIIVKEVFRAIKEDANIQVVLPPGALDVMATGGNAGGPVTVTGMNINFSKGDGLVQ